MYSVSNTTDIEALGSSFYYHMSMEAKYPWCVASMNPRETVGMSYVGDY